MTRGLEHLSSEGRLRELGLGEEKAVGRLCNSLSVPEGGL